MKKIILGSLLLLNILTSMKVLAQEKTLSLKDALQQAATGNRQLQIQAMENQRSAITVREKKSLLLPTVNVYGGYTLNTERPVIYLRNENQDIKLNDVRYGGRHSFEGVISAAYPLLNPVIKSSILDAGIQEEIGRQQTKQVEEQLAMNVSQVYLAILLNGEQLALLRQSMKRNEKALADSRSLFLQGKSLKTDTLANYIAIQNLVSAISSLQNNTEVLKLQLKQLMGIDDSIKIVLNDTLENQIDHIVITHPDSLLFTAMNNRKDIIAAELQVEQKREQQQAARANYKPQLWAIAQYQLQGQADNLKIWDYRIPRTSFAGLRLSIPIYNGGRQKYQDRQAMISIGQSEKTLADLKSTIGTEVHAANANLGESWRQLVIQDQNVEAAQINYNMMHDRYTHGLGSRLELSDAELALTKARLNRVQAIYQIRLTELQMKKATGTLALQ
ncbi:TolC family protein [Flavihumibacter stibioxidans]|uniref:Outer membrane protein TolC n=1 Tax=Flavihumibacter stibioxidans TaxID=1834163 RepID=A0ABR7MCX5_9BACT|nr:TolC family protein [Flavihumibacter stibioxidans]MBC6492797.1 hypothetical protein [Flavihumibacter stibioxidans]